MTATTLTARRRLMRAMAAVWLIAPLLLMAARWPAWWTWIAPEQTPMTWLQSVALVVAAVGALLIVHIGRLADGDAAPAARAPGPSSAGAWWVLAAGFMALAIDERFALHERLRDGVLAPRGVTVPFLPWVGPGDFLLLLVGLIGLALLPVVWRAVAGDIAARRALAVGVGLAIVAVGMDSIDPSTWTAQQERIQQTAEEVIELGSGLCLLTAVWLYLLSVLERFVRIAPTTQEHVDGREPARRPNVAERSDATGDRAHL